MAEIDHRKKKRDFTQVLDEQQKQLIMQYVKEYEAYLVSISNNIHTKCPKLEIEEIKQQIIYVLLSSVKHFDGRLGSAFTTYLSQIALNEGKTIVRRYWQDKNKANALSISLDDYIHIEDNSGKESINVVFENGAVESNPVNVYEESLVNQKIANISERLSKRDKRSFLLYLDGYSASEIAKVLKCNKASVYAAIKKARKIYENEFMSKGK